jgi:hypothetical protein
VSKILVFLFILFVGKILSQKTIVEYYEYNISNGLVDNWINDFEKDQNGFIWIATNDGISRFDGYNFMNFTTENYSIIPENTSFEDIQIHGNLLYAISGLHGIFTINTTNFEISHIEKKGVTAFLKSGKKTLTYFTNGVLSLSENNKIRGEKSFGPETLNGKILLVGNYIYFNKSFANLYKLDLNLNVLSKCDLDESVNGFFLENHPQLGVVIGTSKGLFQEKNNSFIPYGQQNKENKYSYYGITKGCKPFYVLNYKTPFLPFHNGYYPFTFEKTQNTEVRTIFHLGTDYWLIGTNQGFCKLYVGNRFNTQIKDNLFDENQIRVRRKIISLNDDLFLLGFPGIVSFNLKTNIQNFVSKDRKELSNYDALKIGNEIYSTSEGYGVWKINTQNNQITQITTPMIRSDAYYYCMYQLDNQQILFGGKGEFVVFNTRTNESEKYTITKDLEIYDFEATENENQTLIATNKGLFSVNLQNKIRKNNISTISVNSINDIGIRIKDILKHSKQKNYWLATDNGVVILNSKLQLIKKFSGKNEITNPKVTGLLEDNSGKVWASTYSGITCFDLMSGKNYFISTKHGLINSEFNYKSFEKLDDGKLIFGGLYGYDIIDPNLFNFKISKAKIIFSGYRTEKQGEQNSINLHQPSKIEFNTGQEDLLLYFSSSDFNNAEMFSFEYKINDGEWEVLPKNNILRISNLKGGKNKLIIRLRDSFSNICDTKEFEIIARIPFYYEPFFFIIITLLIVTLSFLAVYYFNRIRHIEVETKKRIAMDLHDETGTILTRVLLMSKSESLITKNKDVFQSSLKEALFSLRTFMDSLSGKKGYLSDLLLELKELVSTSFKGNKILPSYKIEKIENIKLSAELYRDIKLCLYEAIQNTMKHSDSDYFELYIYQKNNRLHMEISDQGETTLPLEDLKEKGNGLRNFSKRTNRHNGSVNIELKGQNKSVHLMFEFPLK